MSMRVTHPGILSLLQDRGRLGQHRLGLSTGGPLDSEAFHLCNRLLQNPTGSTAIEISAGGLQLLCTADTWICLTGAPMPLSVNDHEHDNWAVHRVREGDAIEVGFLPCRGTRLPRCGGWLFYRAQFRQYRYRCEGRHRRIVRESVKYGRQPPLPRAEGVQIAFFTLQGASPLFA